MSLDALNQLALIKKMAAGVLTYKLGLPSYGDSKIGKWEKGIKKIVYPSSSLVYSELVFGCGKKLVPFSPGTNGE